MSLGSALEVIVLEQSMSTAALLQRSVSCAASVIAQVQSLHCIYHVLIVCEQCASAAAVCIADAMCAADVAVGDARCLGEAFGSWCQQQEDNSALSSADTCELPNA